VGFLIFSANRRRVSDSTRQSFFMFLKNVHRACGLTLGEATFAKSLFLEWSTPSAALDEHFAQCFWAFAECLWTRRLRAFP
jgi:hypothetical protein